MKRPKILDENEGKSSYERIRELYEAINKQRKRDDNWDGNDCIDDYIDDEYEE